MTASFTIAQVERFKREAKRLHRDTNIHIAKRWIR